MRAGKRRIGPVGQMTPDPPETPVMADKHAAPTASLYGDGAVLATGTPAPSGVEPAMYGPGRLP
jgi:hypothetical protein